MSGKYQQNFSKERKISLVYFCCSFPAFIFLFFSFCIQENVFGAQQYLSPIDFLTQESKILKIENYLLIEVSKVKNKTIQTAIWFPKHGESENFIIIICRRTRQQQQYRSFFNILENFLEENGGNLIMRKDMIEKEIKRLLSTQISKELLLIVFDEYSKFIQEFPQVDYPAFEDVLQLISTESSWNPKQETPYQRGLMQISRFQVEQINKIYKTNFQYDEMFDPRKNVFVGIRYLRWLYRYFQTIIQKTTQVKQEQVSLNHNQVQLAIMQYNYGVGNIEKWLTQQKQDNKIIDESISEETKQHLIDNIFWTFLFKYQISSKLLDTTSFESELRKQK